MVKIHGVFGHRFTDFTGALEHPWHDFFLAQWMSNKLRVFEAFTVELTTQKITWTMKDRAHLD